MAKAILTLRPGTPGDAQVCGRICHEAFGTLAEHHRFPPDFASPEHAAETLGRLLARPRFHSVVAELDGRVVGSNFLDERSTIAGLGPITVDVDTQTSGVGRKLMVTVLDRARERDTAGIRLLQSAYHSRSLALYAGLGFAVREILL